MPLEAAHKDQVQDRPTKRVKFSSPAPSSPTDNFKRTIRPALALSPITCSYISQVQVNKSPNTPGPSVVNEDSPAAGPASLSGSAAPLDISNSGLSDGLQSRPISRKPLKALASFLSGFLETARHATQSEASTKPRGSTRYHQAAKVLLSCPDPTSITHKLTHEIPNECNSNRASQTTRLRPLSTMGSYIRTAIHNPSSSVTELTRQPSSLEKPVLLRTLTSRSHLLFKSVSPQTAVSQPLSITMRNVIPHMASSAAPPALGSSTTTASQQVITQVIHPQYASSPSSKTTIGSLLHPAVLPRPKAVLSGAHSPSEILAALRPPKSQIVLYSNPLRSEHSSPNLPPFVQLQ